MVNTEKYPHNFEIKTRNMIPPDAWVEEDATIVFDTIIFRIEPPFDGPKYSYTVHVKDVEQEVYFRLKYG